MTETKHPGREIDGSPRPRATLFAQSVPASSRGVVKQSFSPWPHQGRSWVEKVKSRRGGRQGPEPAAGSRDNRRPRRPPPTGARAPPRLNRCPPDGRPLPARDTGPPPARSPPAAWCCGTLTDEERNARASALENRQGARGGGAPASAEIEGAAARNERDSVERDRSARRAEGAPKRVRGRTAGRHDDEAQRKAEQEAQEALSADDEAKGQDGPPAATSHSDQPAQTSSPRSRTTTARRRTTPPRLAARRGPRLAPKPTRGRPPEEPRTALTVGHRARRRRGARSRFGRVPFRRRVQRLKGPCREMNRRRSSSAKSRSPRRSRSRSSPTRMGGAPRST